MRYTKALIIHYFLIHAVEVTFIDGKRKKGRIILNNDPVAYCSLPAAKFALLPPLTATEGPTCFNPSHVRKIEFYRSSDHIKTED